MNTYVPDDNRKRVDRRMAQKIYVVEGRQFRTDADYRMALRDKQIIDQLREKVDFTDTGQLSKLVKELQQNKVRFHTILGQDFAEEAEDALKRLQKQPPAQNRKKKKNSAVVKEKVRTGQKLHGSEPMKTLQTGAGKKQDAEMEKYVQEELRRRERLRRGLALLCSVIAVLCLGYFTVYAYQTVRTQREFERLAAMREQAQEQTEGDSSTLVIHYTEEGQQETPEILEEYKSLYNINKRLIGWLKIDDTIIDYPVMQTTNNEYYLDHNINQQTDKNGALFLDKDCDVLAPSTNLIIYGHHMKNGNMFGTLDKYSSEEYYREHPIIQFDTIYERGTYEIMYVFRSRIYNEEDVVFKYYQFIDAVSEQEFDSNIQEMAAMSLYDTGVTASYGDRLLTLSTCDYYVDDGRFVVVAKRIED